MFLMFFVWARSSIRTRRSGFQFLVSAAAPSSHKAFKSFCSHRISWQGIFFLLRRNILKDEHLPTFLPDVRILGLNFCLFVLTSPTPSPAETVARLWGSRRTHSRCHTTSSHSGSFPVATLSSQTLSTTQEWMHVFENFIYPSSSWLCITPIPSIHTWSL